MKEQELLEKVKEQYTKDRGFESWVELYINTPPYNFEKLYNEISQRYASELLKLKIEAARHNDGTEPKNSDPEYWKGWHEALDYLENQ